MARRSKKYSRISQINGETNFFYTREFCDLIKAASTTLDKKDYKLVKYVAKRQSDYECRRTGHSVWRHRSAYMHVK